MKTVMKRGVEREVLIGMIIMLLTLAVLITITIMLRGKFPSLGGLP